MCATLKARGFLNVNLHFRQETFQQFPRKLVRHLPHEAPIKFLAGFVVFYNFSIL